MRESQRGKFASGLIWFAKSWLWLIPVLFAFDIVTKLVFERVLLAQPGQKIVVIPGFFSFELLYNTGAAWGILAGKDWLLVTISLVAGLAMTGFLIWKYKSLSTFVRVALCLTIPGAFGNLIDRAFYSRGVIDFLRFTFIDFPTFNFADAFLVIGCAILIIGEITGEIRDHLHKRKEEKTDVDLHEVGKKLSHEDPTEGDSTDEKPQP